VAGLKSIRRKLVAALDAGISLGGIGEYYLPGEVSSRVRNSLLRLHCRTNGRGTALLTPIMRALRPPRSRKPASGFLGTISVQKQDAIAAAIARDGFYVFENLLPKALCDEIEAHARSTPAQLENGNSPALFDEKNPVSKTYRIREGDIVRCQAFQQLMADQSILAIAETYLKTLPILSCLNLWFSPAYGNAPGADAAQQYHFDFDPPPVWLLFFVYLTDVGPDNGPHVFVRGTHAPGAPGMEDLLLRGYERIPEEDVAARYKASDIVELYGKRGTILAVDTRGMHKGKMPVIGHRLIAQLTFSCPPFSGAHGRSTALPANLHPALSRALETLPQVYEHFKVQAAKV
jgi:hypothetical protein